MKIILTILLFTVSISYSQWFVQNSGTTSNLTSLYFIDTETGYVCGDNGCLLKTTNGGTLWLPSSLDTNLHFSFITFRNAQTGYCLGNDTDNKLLYTTNGGLNWLFKMNIPSQYLPRNIIFLNNITGYISGAGIPYKTTDGGVSWQVFQPQTSNNRNILLSSFKVNENKIFWVGSKYHPPAQDDAIVYFTTNGGQSFTESILPSTQMIDVSFFDINTGYLVGLGYFGKSTDGGLNWNYVDTPPLYGTSVCYSASNKVFTASGYGLYYSDNGGLNFNLQYHAYLNKVKMLNENTGYCVGFYGRILKTTNGGIIGINNISTEIPEQFSLSQNYPNPFNPTTKIRFDISGTSAAQAFLSVFDVTGREVAVLVSQELKPGTFEVDWDASNFPSGVYFYKLTAGSFSETKKMVLIK